MRTGILAVVTLILLPLVMPGAESPAGLVRVGQGSYTTRLPEGAKLPPPPIRLTPGEKRPVPTSDWWSALVWSTNHFAQHPHPLAVIPQKQGLRIAYPGARITASKAGIFANMPGSGDDFILAHSGQSEFPPPLLVDASDWFVTARFTAGANSLTVSYGHGSPYVFARQAGGSPKLIFSRPPRVWSGNERSQTLGIEVNGRFYGLFGPAGCSWQGLGSSVVTCQSARDYFSVAALPDSSEGTLSLFQRHAHAQVSGTQVEWQYAASNSTVTTRFAYQTTPLEGAETNTLFALYPHQWRHTETPLLAHTYGSVRGVMKLGQGSSFATRMRYPGVLPAVPDAGGVDHETMRRLLEPELAKLSVGVADTYATGKRLGRWATLAPLAEQGGATQVAAGLRSAIRGQLENWLSADARPERPGRKGVFHYDDRWGTLIGYPASFGSDLELNDHHFHYGYFIKAAAEIAVADPAWAADHHWGGMVRLLIRDIASPDHRDPLFPFLRCFDPYAGHSWASGHARFGDGNNNESSSEAMNAWCGLILWGAATGAAAVRDLGICLFTTELHAIEEYWFDVHGTNFPRDYPASVVTMVWGGKGANATWFSADPQMVHGINWLPLHGGSLYLGLHPDYAEKNYRALVAEHGSDRFTRWADLAWMYRALSDSVDAVRLFEAAGPEAKTEDGNSRAATAHWIYNLRRLGTVDGSVTADWPLYAVFRSPQGRSHAAFNPTASPCKVRFSDGFELNVPPRSMTLDRGQPAK